MRQFKSKAKNILYLIYRWINTLVDPLKIINFLPGLGFYIHDSIKYARMKEAERIKFINTYPCLHDRLSATPFDAQYFYQDIWAYKKIHSSNIKEHIDVGSNIIFTSLLSSVCDVTFIDIRPLDVEVKNFKSLKGSVLDMPYKADSIRSLSCLHVIEHVGLGRYGDPLDPEGSKKACLELSRVLARGGDLYISLPVGKKRLCFNAHRVHPPKEIVDYLRNLELVGFSVINDKGEFIEDTDYMSYNDADYSCGLFHFRKK
jgi:hypothetical protein